MINVQKSARSKKLEMSYGVFGGVWVSWPLPWIVASNLREVVGVLYPEHHVIIEKFFFFFLGFGCATTRNFTQVRLTGSFCKTEPRRT